MKNKIKTIGILGGMGPAASSYFHQIIIDTAQEKYDAKLDSDFPHIVHNSIALSGFDQTGDLSDSKIQDELKKGLELLENAGAEVISVPCNTIHLFYPFMAGCVGVPIINIIEACSEQIMSDGINCVGVLCSKETRNTGLYQKALKKKGLQTIVSSAQQQSIIDNVIFKAMGGELTNNETDRLISIFSEYKEEGAEAMLLGCTELPLAVNQEQTNYKLYSSLHILAEEVLEYAYGY